MPIFSVFGKPVELLATPALVARTRDETAWLHRRYLSCRLWGTTEALRVHTAGKAFPGRDASNEAGAWLLIGDVIQTSGQLADSRALPATNPHGFTAFTHVSIAILGPGTVLNVGIAAAKFGGRGGELQAEYVAGPPIIFKTLHGKYWHGSFAHA